jgi:hypothetical protein
MTGWSLPALLGNLHDDIERRLREARALLGHPVEKGDASEAIWLELFDRYLPKRYKAQKAYVVDSEGSFSEQIDIVILDRQYSPIIFQFQGATIVPAESVYAVFEAKQSIDADEVAYAQRKVASVRKLKRTTLPIRHAGGTFDPVEPQSILGGLLAFESGWKPALGPALLSALRAADERERLDLGCVAAHGVFGCDPSGCHSHTLGGKPATAFLLELIARLQESGTVARLDIRAYAAWLAK